MSRRGFLMGAAALLAGGTGGARAQQAPAARPRPVSRLVVSLVPTTSGCEALMSTSRAFRIVAPASPTLCLVDKGVLHGTVPEGAQIVEQWVNRTYRTGRRPATSSLVVGRTCCRR